MVGQAFNPDNCAFIANQALNSNQGGSVPYTNNLSVHKVMWDFVDEKLLWVNTQTGLIDAEIPGANACDFVADITYVGEVPPPGEILPQAPANNYRYTCTASNGVAPFTYKWSIESAPNIDFAIVGSTTNQNVDLENIAGGIINTSLIRCEVTDAEGCITQAYFLAYVQALV